MSRVAGLLVAIPAVLLALAPAFAADRPMGRGSGGVAVTVDDCRAPRVEVARYQEQVCQKGVGGYVACRWVEREHAVRTAGVCEPVDTIESSRPAARGAFPPLARTPRG